MGRRSVRFGSVVAIAAVLLGTTGCDVVTDVQTVNGTCASQLPAPWGNGPYTQTVKATATPAQIPVGGTIWYDLDLSVVPSLLFSHRYSIEYRFNLRGDFVPRTITFPAGGGGHWSGSWRVENEYLFVTVVGTGLPEDAVDPPNLHIETSVRPTLLAGSTMFWPMYDVAHLTYAFDLSPAEAWCVPNNQARDVAGVLIVP